MRRLLLSLLLCLAAATASAADTKIVLIAGHPSHGPGEHEFNAGTLLLAKCLGAIPGIQPVVVHNGWPQDERVFDGARAVVFYMDGGAGHPMIQDHHMETMKTLMDRGVGLVCLHYAVEFPKGKFGDQLLDWLGGYYETGYSQNPVNTVTVTPAAKDHPICRGVKPFTARDEWYYRIRFRPGDPRVTPILTAMLPAGKNAQKETVAWATERANGGRSFGFTGAHYHKNWGIPDFRRTVLNAILWAAKLDVPSGGVHCSVSPAELARNLDKKR